MQNPMTGNSPDTQSPEEISASSGFPNPLGGSKPFDIVTDVFIPACILGMAVSFAYFLLEIRAVAADTGSYALRYACFWFLTAVVLISRLRTKYGGATVAVPYQIALAGAMLLFLFRFSGDVGSLAGGVFSGVLVNCLIVAVTWWGISKLTDECTIEEETADETNEGLLSAFRKPTEAKQEVAQQHHKRRHPGRLVIYFALGALVVFGLSQKALALGGPDSASVAFRWMVAYIFFALSLLATTSLSGLRLYLRRRDLHMERGLPSRWITASGLMVIALLTLAGLMPRMAAEARVWVVSTIAHRRSPSKQEVPFQSPVEGFRAPRGETRTATEEPGYRRADDPTQTAGQPDRRGAGQSRGKAQAPSQQPGESGQLNPAMSGRQGGKSGGKGTGSEQSGQGRGESPAHGREASPQPQNQGHDRQNGTETTQRSGQKQDDPNRESRGQTPQRQAQRDQAPHNPVTRHRQRNSPSLALLSRLLSLLAIIAVILTTLFYLVRNLRLLRNFLKRLARCLPALSPLWHRFGGLIDRILRLFSRRPEGKGSPSSLYPRKRSGNPFTEDRFFETMLPADSIRHAYGQFLEYAEMRGCPRKEQWTPLEFLRRLPDPLSGLKEEAAVLTQLYVLAAYTPTEVSPAHLEQLRSRWSHFAEHAGQFLLTQKATA
ncbi:MAG: DUF4129 domain-containing protein [Armatimonadetes bacterium]|nr:DUF4129 domain-containing protein [Armatimonadota bacterium]